MSSLYNPEIEANSIALLLRHGKEIWSEFAYAIEAEDYSPNNRVVWDHIKLQLDKPDGSVDPLFLSERIKASGVSQLQDSFDPYEYLVGLKDARFVEKEQAATYVNELKRLRIRRDLIFNIDKARKKLIEDSTVSIDAMTGIVEKSLTEVATHYTKADTTEVYGNVIDVVEKRGDNPLKPDEVGFLGPFKSINDTIGPLTYRGSYTVIGARSSVGKSAFGWFYQTYLLEKYPNLHLLHLDAAEMTFEELAFRAVCCLSKGVIPYHAAFRGEWKKNPEWKKLIEHELWPRAKKMVNRMSFKNVGMMSPKDKIAFIRKYYYNKVGRGNHLLLHDDYLKGIESLNKNTQEYQAIGFYVADTKSLITEEIPGSMWTSVQNNRMGIVNGKKESEINDSEEAFSMSDRILQQSTHSFSMRPKIAEEMAREQRQFGNMRLTPLKKRQLLGERYKEMLNWVKLPNGKLLPNYFNLEAMSFYYQDKGSLREMVDHLGNLAGAPTNASNGGKAF